MNLAHSPYEAYRRTQVTTASQGELILLAYEGALKWLTSARVELERKKPDVETVHECLVRAQDIIAELQSALRLEEGYEIGSALYQLYDYMLQQLVQANVHKDIQRVDEVLGMLRELQEAWVAIIRGTPAPAEAQEPQHPQVGQVRRLNVSG